MTIINYPITTNVFDEFLTQVSLFAGYFIIKNWSSSYNPKVWVNFLFSLVVINSIASVFFILHQGLHFGIYVIDEEQITDFVQGVEITRSFYYMPQFMFLSIAFALVFKNKNLFYSALILIINLLAIFITYTRSFLIIAIVIFLFYFILTGLKNGKLGVIFKNVVIYGLLGIFGFFIISKFLPANTKYFMDRFSELKSSSKGEENNLQFRFRNTGEILSKIDENNKILGMGSASEFQSKLFIPMRSATADMVWTGVIFRWGFGGLILFIIIYISSITRAFNFYMKSNGVLSDLALLFLIYLVSQVIESFTSWTFLSGHGYAIGLWYFAMTSALVGLNKNNRKGLSNEEILINE